MSSENILELENIEVVYDDVILALYDVTLNVPKGKIVALLGGNGAGNYQLHYHLIKQRSFLLERLK